MTVHTVADVAGMLGASESFIRNLARQHRVPCLRVGRGAYRFTDEHVEAIRDYLTQPVVPGPPERLTSARSRPRRSA